MGIPEILQIALTPVEGIQAAFVFGSIAKGTSTSESDVDVLVIGDSIARAELAEHSMEAAMLLGREVNPVVYSLEELSERVRSGSRFVDEVLRGPKSWIIGDEYVLAPVVRGG